MYKNDSDDESSDDSLRDEIEAISRVCRYDADKPSCSVPNAAGGFLFDDDDDDDDDLELVRSIQERYGVGAGAGVVDNIKPLATLPPFVPDDDDDEDDDFEFYRAIKERFSKCDGDGATGSRGDATASKDSEAGGHIDKSLSNDAIGTTLAEYLDVGRDDIEQEPCGTGEVESASGSASSFPRAAQTFIEAIKRNRCCQKFIRNKLLYIKARIEEVNKLRKRFKTLRDFQVECKKKIGRALSQKQDARIQLIAVPKQRASAKERNVSAMCYGPLENSYVPCYKAALEKFPLSFHRDKWSGEEKEKLEKGIVRQYQEKLLQRSVHVLSAADGPYPTNGVDGMISSVRNHNITPELLQHFLSEVNWEQLASTYLSRRSGAECEARWLNHESRLINKDHWTAHEDRTLLYIIQENGIYDWGLIADKLGTNRTPFQCLARYQRSLNSRVLKTDWTVDEDARLRAAVETSGESNWQAVASLMEGRTGTQCSNRWKKTLHPTREKVGKWSEDEDKRLRVAVTLFGKSWHRIAQFVPGRTQVQCRERWVNVLDPSLKHGEWTEEEDLKLRAAISEHGYCWSKIAACISSRTDNQCRRRWKVLFPDDADLLKADRSLQKAALISNFVDREVERPALRAKDFVSQRIEGPRNEHGKNDGQQELGKSSHCLKKSKRKKIALSPDTNCTGDTKKRKTSKSSSKTKKHSDIKHKKRPQKQSCESTGSDSDIDDWDPRIRLISRRARGVRSKANHPNDGCSVNYLGGGDIPFFEQIELDNVRSTSSNSQVKICKEAEFSNMEDMLRKPISSKLQPQWKSSTKTSLGDDNCIADDGGTSKYGSEANRTSKAGSIKYYTRRKHGKCKSDPDKSKDWEDVPLSVLFSDTLTRPHLKIHNQGGKDSGG